MKYHNYSNEQLNRLLDSFEKNTVAAIKKAAGVLVELNKRRQFHPLMQSDVLRYYQEIDNGTISARAVLILGIQPNRFDAVKRLPVEVQDEICDGKEFVIADHNESGEIVSKAMPYKRMSIWQLRMVFANGKVQPFVEQKKVLAARIKDVRRSEKPIDIRADKNKGEIVCGQLRFTPHQLSGALKELGFKLERIKP